MNETVANNILITGVSSGIGQGLAEHYLSRGEKVFGLSRRTPSDLIDCGLKFVTCDLNEAITIRPSIENLLANVQRLHLVVLNAGILGRFGDFADSSLDDLKHTMQINVWANVTVLNSIYERGVVVDQVVAISSGASVNGNRGWSGYSVSKAALNMLVRLYSREQSSTHFCAFAPGLVDTAMQDELCSRTADERFPAIAVLQSKRQTPEMPEPRQAASMLAAAIEQLPDGVPSGDYADIRNLPSL
jgi:NAD(P)-dependent dehydrogenase (short-subunit alcohol dehydrogenase family)